jgi:hypothetical protein
MNSIPLSIQKGSQKNPDRQFLWAKAPNDVINATISKKAARKAGRGCKTMHRDDANIGS